MIYSELSAGLGNRLLALASAIYLAKDCNEQLEVIWDVGNGFGAHFQDLFVVPPNVTIKNISRERFTKAPILSLLSRSYIQKLYKKTTLLLRSGGIKVIRDNGGGYDTIKQLIEIERDIHIDAYSCYLPPDKMCHDSFSMIKPSEQMKSFAQSTLKKLPNNCYGFHIRRTDHFDSISHSPTSLFIDKISELVEIDSTAVFYIASDDLDVIDEIQGHVGTAKIVTQDSRVLSRKSKQGALCAYTDMLCLSKCKTIFGSFGSTFSLVASLLGNCSLEILSDSKK